ncbi:BAG family molecular chaperone regulator 2-like [Nicotiana tabacum]|uniref:BAG family molecular chaperone regulator 2-like n=1 Tax=Nicotiana tabacum TaxID=4097 RepID=A0A1S4D8J5_TOBAC|nr:PREDICTED: BAG family molecular chaperone regulator 2-like [Nicotiana tabacum]
MIKLRSKRLSRSNSKVRRSGTEAAGKSIVGSKSINCGEIKWELRPGGMLVQKRECDNINGGETIITLRVSTVSNWHDISIQPTSTFGELKMMLSMVTGLEPKEQRLLYRGKEREDYEHLHMVGVRDKDKVLLFQFPPIKESLQVIGGSPYRTISV